MIWLMEKLSGETVKSSTWPSLEPFLVSTLRPGRLKLSSKTWLNLMMSSGALSSSTLSMTMPSVEYSRIDLISRYFASRTRPPVSKKAMI